MLKSLAAIAVVFFCLAVTVTAQNSKNEGGVPMELVVKAIQEALKEAESVEVPHFDLALTGVTVELKTIVTKRKGIGINFWIFSFGKSKEWAASSTITITLTAPEQPAVKVEFYDPEKLKHVMSGAIIEAKKGYVAASAIDQNLTDRSVTLNFNFAVTSETKGGINITDIIPVGVEVSGSYSKSFVHSIELVFTKLVKTRSDAARERILQ